MLSGRRLAAHLARRFLALFGIAEGLRIALAPGRVNLIGEHTDYNDGWALPMAIDRYVGVAFRARADRLIRAHAVAFDEAREIDLDEPRLRNDRSWTSYVAGMARLMTESGIELTGLDCVVDGDLPIGSGLASSAATEMAVARALCSASGAPWSPRPMARLGQQAEHRFAGVRCGIMDQLTSALAEAGSALLLDCRSAAAEAVAVPERAAVVVMDTGSRRSLAQSAYNDRRARCEAAVSVLRRLDPRVRALRDAGADLLESARPEMDERTFRAARHVVEENLRPAAMAAALRRGRLDEAGELMNDSHRSLRDLYEVSSSELDLVTDLARRHPACFGARLTGAGFGGCAVALVASVGARSFISEVHTAYRATVELPSELFACRPAAGARLLRPVDGIDGPSPDFVEE